ncbi:hypothetical protein GHT07_00485 [Caenimonas koreensis DSM 17982]|uniref:Peptidyl-prolyl cis-trans isomerase n=1 Tax=Caenimonas koreensis DSM 17982 TaxID=1121255 RepID=A0A844B2G1_9BURK|nr:peptidylprolyl isomerase [Caenimonas koreensis]MRD45737.1 hypothetical protein [Caenimonas koreensis DSM 17982]
MSSPSPTMKFLARLLVAPLLALCAAAPVLAGVVPENTMVRIQTNVGLLDFKLLDAEAPATVANFRGYVSRGDYVDSFFHRSIASFIIQAGGYRWPDGSNYGLVPTQPPVVNEFSPTRSNLRGTVAMAKVDGQPNSATNQWFINMVNNAANLDNQNSGFTVFARVTATTMLNADQMAGLPRYNVNGTPFTSVPLTQATWGRPYVIRILAATEIPSSSPVDRIFNYLESAYPAYVGALPTWSGEAYYFTYRYYAGANSYLGEKDGHIWYYAPAWMTDVYDLGTTESWFATATANGY